jgi:hypothetical protein
MSRSAPAVATDLVARYRRDGYTVLPGLLTETDRARLGSVFDRLFAAREAIDDADFHDVMGRPAEAGDDASGLLQIVRAEKYAPELLEQPHFARCRAVAGVLLDAPPDSLDVFVHLMSKAARTGPETPWHQDEAYMDPAWERRGLSIWAPLEGASVESGCLHFVPGSHRSSVLAHGHAGGDDRVRALVTDRVDVRAALPCPLAAGDASVHDLRTLHYAGPNLTGAPRRAYVLVFMTPAVAAAEPEARPWL